MIPITTKKKELTKRKTQSINKKNVCVERDVYVWDVWDVWDVYVRDVYVKRTISKIQRDKNQIIFPRDGFECDGGDVGVVEICRVVHYDVLFVFCVRKKGKKKIRIR